ncbi:MAG TPA: hypothetical protein VI818_04890 [Candidatus Thermoplasmatota archaeon]|nr:hypothetical protein [Candidatus Thermoplasmatota archaeon]
MISPRARSAIGHGLLGLGIGVLVFAVFYVFTFRMGISERFVWSWVGIHLFMLLAPAVGLALYGANKAKPEMAA